jgi:hypothetical protein
VFAELERRGIDMISVLSHRSLQALGAVLLMFISGGHIVSGVITSRTRVPFVTDGLLWEAHPVYFMLVMAFWAFVFIGTVLSMWTAFRDRPAAR